MTVEVYAFAEAEFHTYKRALADQAARLAEAAAALRDRTDRVSVSGPGSVSGHAPEDVVIGGRGLPRSEDIRQTLVLYRGAYERLCATWDGLRPPEREGLRPPPPSLPTLRQKGI